ncbi:MAG: hypothetical protein AAF708_05890 [Deinococcota bacterium]
MIYIDPNQAREKLKNLRREAETARSTQKRRKQRIKNVLASVSAKLAGTSARAIPCDLDSTNLDSTNLDSTSCDQTFA